MVKEQFLHSIYKHVEVVFLLGGLFIFRQNTLMTASLIISIVALVISGANLGWNMYQYFDKLRRKLRIDFKCRQIPGKREFSSYGFVITNASQVPIMIDTYEFYFGDEKQHTAFLELANKIMTPIKLDAGHQFDIYVSASSFWEAMNNNKADKVRLKVVDTLGKQYKSEWLNNPAKGI